MDLPSPSTAPGLVMIGRPMARPVEAAERERIVLCRTHGVAAWPKCHQPRDEGSDRHEDRLDERAGVRRLHGTRQGARPRVPQQGDDALTGGETGGQRSSSPASSHGVDVRRCEATAI